MAKTVFKVEIRNGAKVFVLGEILRSYLSALDFLPANSSREPEIRVRRGGVVIDRGEVVEIGTHDAGYYICGLEVAIPQDISPRRENHHMAVMEGSILASWFEEGDEISVNCFKKDILLNLS